MELILLDSYRKFVEKNQPSFFKRFMRMPKIAIVLFSLLCAIFVVDVALIWVDFLCAFIFIPVCVEIIVCAVLFLYTEHYQISQSDNRLMRYRESSGGLHKWLTDAGLCDTADSYKEIKRRIEKRIDEAEIKRKETQVAIWHVIEIVLYPLLLAAFTSGIANLTDMPQLITALLGIILCLSAVGAIMYLVYSIYSLKDKTRIEQMRNFAEALQGVLDTQFEKGRLVASCVSAENKKQPQKPTAKKEENAGKPWSAEDDEKLRKMHTSGCSRKEMCNYFGRSNNAISSRLVHLGVIQDKVNSQMQK